MALALVIAFSLLFLIAEKTLSYADHSPGSARMLCCDDFAISVFPGSSVSLTRRSRVDVERSKICLFGLVEVVEEL